MKARYITMSSLLADTWITAMLTAGYESRKWRVTQGLPGDAKMVDIRLVKEPIKAITFLFESESFEDVPDPYALPPMVVITESIT